MKQAAKTINHHKVVYKVNETMQEELNLFAQTLSVTPSIKFVTPIAFLIPRTPSASIFGNSSLLACGGYSISQKFLWHLDFPEMVVDSVTYPKSSGQEILLNKLPQVCHNYYQFLQSSCASPTT